MTRRPRGGAPGQPADARPEMFGALAFRLCCTSEPPDRRSSRTEVDGQRLTATAGRCCGRQQRFADRFRFSAHRTNALREVLRRYARMRCPRAEYPPSKCRGPGRVLHFRSMRTSLKIDTRMGQENGRRHHVAAANLPEEAQLNAGTPYFCCPAHGEPFGDRPAPSPSRHGIDVTDSRCNNAGNRYVRRGRAAHRGRRRGRSSRRRARTSRLTTVSR